MSDNYRERYLAAKRRLFDKVIEQRLNARQREAVCTTEGPLLVLAGAGSGKTTVLVQRIAFIIKYGNAYHSDALPAGLNEEQVAELEKAIHLPPAEIEEGVLPEFIISPCPPWAVLAITFTNKAAGEIKERLADAFDDEGLSEQIWSGTFHSICMRILRRWPQEAGLPGTFTIYDTDDKRHLILHTMRELDISDKILPPKAVMSAISAAKDALITPEAYEAGKNPREKDILRIYEAYQKKLQAFGALDFDDIIMKTVQVLETHAPIREYYQKKFRYVCVDEYQDTNKAQFHLTRLLSGGYRNLMVVGDDDQSIYRFRGAVVENILSFSRTFPDAKVVKLEQNYRSTKHILEAANAVISHNTNRHDKRLWSAAGAGDLLQLRQCQDQYDEARYITDTIMSTVVREKRRYRDFAVLYRINEMGRSLEGGFAKSGIPYRVLGSQRFYDRKEIRDIVAYLTVIVNPADNQRLKRIINEPKRKIGTAALEAAEQVSLTTGQGLFEVLERAQEDAALAKYAEKFQAFCGLIRSLQHRDLSPSALIEAIFVETGYRDMLEAEGEVAKVRIDSVKEFISAAEEYEGRTEEPVLTEFLEETALVSDVDQYDADSDAVVLMTIHSAKGLEFPIVFLPGMEEGIFPGMQSAMNPEELGEERRLAYVALTRARERVYITHAKTRTLYGRTTANPLSRFVQEEIPEALLSRQGAVPRFAPPSPRYSFPLSPKAKKQLADIAEAEQKIRPRQTPAGSGKVGAAAYGLKRFGVNARVRHAVFGNGTVLFVKDMGGDILYEVAFDNGQTKKLMATFAKLQEIQ
ncbi:MAG: UvrD-helicase domain-containing protein [Eubacteriales bacterium]